MADRVEMETQVARIWQRYHGQMDKLDFADPAIKAQLAFDLGYLLGALVRALKVDEALP